MRKKILIVAAHPDDEVLGCGGAIAKHAKLGDEVSVLILAEGLTSRDQQRNRSQRSSELLQLAKAAERANQLLGVSNLHLHNLPDNRMDSMDLLDIVKLIESYICKYSPSIVYTHHAGDVNIDHQRIHEAVVTACRPLPGSLISSLLFFEVPSSTEWQISGSAPCFIPNWFIDITDELQQKLSALKIYNSEMREWPHPRSLKAVEHLSHWRGASVGLESAEAFILGRNIVGRQICE